MQLTTTLLIILSLTGAGAAPIISRQTAQSPRSKPDTASTAKPLPAADCTFKILKDSDPVLGGYPSVTGDSGGFDPNTAPHGGNISPDVLRERMFFYYFEVQAVIGDKPGGQVDKNAWTFNQSLDRSGWVALDLGDGKVSRKFDLVMHKAADNPGAGEFVWNSQGYHYASLHGIDIQVPGPDNRLHSIQSADVTWKFTLTGYHDSNGVHDSVCKPVTFSIRMTVENGVPWWTYKQDD